MALGNESLSIRLERSAVRTMLVLAGPVLVENVLAMLVGWSDTLLTGRILREPTFLAAVTVASYLLWLIESCGAVIATGCQAVVGRLMGAGELDEANRIIHQSLRLAVLLGIGVALVVPWAADPMVQRMNLEGEARALAAEYLTVVSLSGPLMMIVLVGATCLRAAGQTSASLLIMTFVNVVNVASSWLLTVGWGPFRRLGWTGIPAGTALGFSAGGLWTLAWLYRGFGQVRLPRRAPRPSTADAWRVLRIGIPGAANALAIVFFQLWFLAIIGRLGAAAVAAHGVAIRCESLSFLMADAFAIAAATTVGQSLGARRANLARRCGWIAFGLGAAAMSALGVLFFTAAPLLFRLFVDRSEPEVLALGVPVLRLVAFGMPALAATMILSGALRGAGDTRWPLLYNTAGFLLVRIPLAYGLVGVPFELGLFGAWMAMLVDLYFRGGLAMGRFIRGRWTHIHV